MQFHKNRMTGIRASKKEKVLIRLLYRTCSSPLVCIGFLKCFLLAALRRRKKALLFSQLFYLLWQNLSYEDYSLFIHSQFHKVYSQSTFCSTIQSTPVNSYPDISYGSSFNSYVSETHLAAISKGISSG